MRRISVGIQYWVTGCRVGLSVWAFPPKTQTQPFPKKKSRNFNLDTGNYSKKILELQSAYFLLDVGSLDRCLNCAFRGQFAACARTLVAGAIHQEVCRRRYVEASIFMRVLFLGNRTKRVRNVSERTKLPMIRAERTGSVW